MKQYRKNKERRREANGNINDSIIMNEIVLKDKTFVDNNTTPTKV
jgi:hypothetical protein